VLSSVKKLIQWPLCCNADMPWTHELHWQQHWNWFFIFIFEACKILSQLQVFRTTFLFSLLPLLSRLSSCFRNKLVKNRPTSYSPARGVTKRVQEGTIPWALNFYGGAESLRGAPNDCGERRKVPTISQVLSSIQYICFRKTSNSNMGVPNLLLALGAMQPR